MSETTEPETIAARWVLVNGDAIVEDLTDAAREDGADAARVQVQLSELLAESDDAAFRVTGLDGALYVLPGRNVLRVEIYGGEAAKAVIRFAD